MIFLSEEEENGNQSLSLNVDYFAFVFSYILCTESKTRKRKMITKKLERVEEFLCFRRLFNYLFFSYSTLAE